ncbi:MAG TPA: hypothetical protein VF186_08135 [Gaiellaceae bacterium]
MLLDRLAAPIRDRRLRRERRAARASADAELLAARLPSPRLAWRTAELTGEAHRLALARALTDAVHEADGRSLPGASPLDRVAVRASRAQLLLLAARLAELERPVRPRGVLLVEALVSGPGSPLYDPAAVEPARARAVLALLALDD